MTANQLIPNSVWELVRRAIHRQPDKTWLYYNDDTYTYGQIDLEVGRRLPWLHNHGARLGRHVLIVLPNSPEFIFAWLAVLRLGATSLAANPALLTPELATLLVKGYPTTVVTSKDLLPRVQEALEIVGSDACIALVDEIPENDGRSHGIDDGPNADTIASLIATSGTTGQPKLVMQPHRSYVLAAEAFPWWLGLTPDDRLLTAMPLFHLNAQVYSTLGSLAAGASLVLLPRFSAREFWNDVNRYEVTQFNALGAMVEILMRQPQTKSEMNNPTRLCYTAPAPSRDRHLEIERRFRLRLIIGYGLSESPFGTVWPVDGASTPYESMGKPRQHPRASVRVNEARVINMHGETVKVGESGELLLRNPAIMTGYLDDPEGTALVLRDGWLHTGDLVRSDEDGWLYFVARQKEVIRRRGENISPVEVEDVLLSHEAVLDAAAIAVPSDLSEDDVKAFIVLRPGFAATAAELHVWCAKNLASFKVPRYIEFIDALPFTPTGRIARHQLLRERVASETDFAVTTSCPPR